MLWFDKLTMSGKNPLVLSLSKDRMCPPSKLLHRLLVVRTFDSLRFSTAPVNLWSNHAPMGSSLLPVWARLFFNAEDHAGDRGVSGNVQVQGVVGCCKLVAFAQVG